MEKLRFGLIVTGVGEREFLPKLFRSIMAAANCQFEVIRKSEQLSPITSRRRIVRMVGRGQRIPSTEEEQYGTPARSFLRKHPYSCVLVIDDLEGSRREKADKVFERYRRILDEALEPLGYAHRASVHFLVNMLEAYYFADSNAVNAAANATVLNEDYPVDVETISHPKSELKKSWPEFHEIRHGSAILGKLDLDHVLQHAERCRWLRTMIAWCIEKIPRDSIWAPDELPKRFRLLDGKREELTGKQLNDSAKSPG
jgi:hypothetical protein